MTKRIDDIARKQYGQCFSTEPSDEDVAEAIKKGELEERGFQEYEHELAAEWYRHPPTECVQLAKQYHARRIAYFVVKGWTDPIQITSVGKLRDGAHRLRAAKFKGEKTIDFIIVP